jgi:Ca2+/Na+ antiporter
VLGFLPGVIVALFVWVVTRLMERRLPPDALKLSELSPRERQQLSLRYTSALFFLVLVVSVAFSFAVQGRLLPLAVASVLALLLVVLCLYLFSRMLAARRR